MKKLTVSAIIPAHNEQKGIKHILKTITQFHGFSEIICINDGSTDKTVSIVKEFPQVKIIDLKKNHGKGYAIKKGVEKTKSDIVMFIDADIKNFTLSSIQKMLTPILSNSYEAVIAYPYKYWFDEVFRPITGERVYYRTHLLPHLSEIGNKGYGMELFLNVKLKHLKTKIVKLTNVYHDNIKYHKQDFNTATTLLFKEFRDILYEIIKQELAQQSILRSYLSFFPIKKMLIQKQKKMISKITEYLWKLKD